MGIEQLDSEVGLKSLVNEIKTFTNVERKKESYKQDQVYKGHSRSYILDYLKTQFSDKTITKMPILSTINICKRIVNKQGSIYVNDVIRSFSGLDEDQQDAINNWYLEEKVNSYFSKANRAYKNHEQAFIMLAPDSDNDLCIRVLKSHNLDAIPSPVNPEKADAYLINSFDKNLAHATNINNLTIADAADYKASLEKYVVWTENSNFIFNGKGNVTSEILENPIGELPIIDISTSKDFEFFVQNSNSIADFNIQFLAGLSDLAQVVKMQGWAVGYLKATKECMPEFVTIGPNMILKLVVDPNSEHVPDFGYASPSADIAGSIVFIETVLASFLSANGLDATVLSTKLGSKSFSSGIERLLAMIEQFEATKEDFELFKSIEDEFYELFKLWNNVFFGTEKEILPFIIPEESEITVEYKKPEMAITESEKTDSIVKKLDNGLITKVEAIAQDRNISEDAAEFIFEKIQNEMMNPLAYQNNEAVMTPEV